MWLIKNPQNETRNNNQFVWPLIMTFKENRQLQLNRTYECINECAGFSLLYTIFASKLKNKRWKRFCLIRQSECEMGNWCKTNPKAVIYWLEIGIYPNKLYGNTKGRNIQMRFLIFLLFFFFLYVYCIHKEQATGTMLKRSDTLHHYYLFHY